MPDPPTNDREGHDFDHAARERKETGRRPLRVCFLPEPIMRWLAVKSCMGYTKRKIRGINFSFLLAGSIFAGWALVCVWFGWPSGFRGASAAGFVLFAAAALFFAAFPVIWARYPAKHPVSHELLRYGALSQMSARLDREMAAQVEVFGPFRFTASFLVYDSGHEFQLVPYDQIVSAEIDRAASDDPAALVVRTRSGRRYQWYRTWLQGMFDPEQVLAKVRTAAHLDDRSGDGSIAGPSAASQSPSAGD